MTDYELYSYEMFRKHLHDDERPIERASLDLLDQGKLQQYILEKSIERPGIAQLTTEQTHEMLNLTRNGKMASRRAFTGYSVRSLRAPVSGSMIVRVFMLRLQKLSACRSMGSRNPNSRIAGMNLWSPFITRDRAFNSLVVQKTGRIRGNISNLCSRDNDSGDRKLREKVCTAG